MLLPSGFRRLRVGLSWLNFRHTATPSADHTRHSFTFRFSHPRILAFSCYLPLRLRPHLHFQGVPSIRALLMVFGSVSDWLSPTIPNKLVEDGQRARRPAMESVGSLPDMRQEGTAGEVEVDSELARPPYIHVRRNPEHRIFRTYN